MGELVSWPEATLFHSNPATVLVVDDDTRLLCITAAMLVAEGYQVLKASRPAEAVRIFERAPSEIDLLLSDVTMPGMNGLELAARIRRVRPDLPVIFMTGQPVQVDTPARVLEKPFGMLDLCDAVAEALGSLALPRMERACPERLRRP